MVAGGNVGVVTVSMSKFTGSTLGCGAGVNRGITRDKVVVMEETLKTFEAELSQLVVP
jgi:hypothetical protein